MARQRVPKGMRWRALFFLITFSQRTTNLGIVAPKSGTTNQRISQLSRKVPKTTLLRI